ncbi:tol-pal system protein YbgF [bacterium]|nr:tol-pal system protein YbgF [bacterium]
MTARMNVSRLFAVVLALVLASGCITTQADKQRQSEIERELAEVKRVAQDTKDVLDRNIGQIAEQQVYFDNMQQEFGAMKGAFDEAQFAKERQAKEYDTLRKYLDLQFEKIDKRLTELERKAGIAPGPAIASVPASPGGLIVKDKPEKDQFEEAVLSFKKSRFGEAQKKFEDFLKKFPQSEHAPEAQFYVGESLFRQNKYSDAILAYDEVVTRWAKSKQAPKAALNQAMAFEKMGQKFDAKLFYEKVMSDYPGTEEAKIAAKKLQLLKK